MTLFKRRTRKKVPRFNWQGTGLGLAYSLAKQSAERRNYAFNISRAQFFRIAQQDCHWCGSPPSNKLKHSVKYSGIDRVDNNKPYTMNNVVPCCKRCNVAKNDMTVGQFKKHIKRIHKHLGL